MVVQQVDQNVNGRLNVVAPRCAVASTLILGRKSEIAVELVHWNFADVSVGDGVFPAAGEAKVNEIDLVWVVAANQDVLQL